MAWTGTALLLQWSRCAPCPTGILAQPIAMARHWRSSQCEQLEALLQKILAQQTCGAIHEQLQHNP